MKHTIFSYGLFALLVLASIVATPPTALAQQMEITRGELEQFYRNLNLKELSLLNYDRREITRQQLDLLIDQIMEHYDTRFQSKNRSSVVYRGQMKNHANQKYDYDSYRLYLRSGYEAPENVEVEHYLQDINIMGQRAEVTSVYDIDMDITPGLEQPMINGSIHTRGESVCKEKLTKEQGRIKLLRQNCRHKALITDVALELPPHMKDINPESLLDGYPW